MSDEASSYPFKWRELTDVESAKLKKVWNEDSYMKDAVISEPGGVCFPRSIIEAGPKIYNFELRPDDVWIVTYPKCGTTWAQEMTWQIMHNIDFEAAAKFIFQRSPFLEYQCLTSETLAKAVLSQLPEDERQLREMTLRKTIEYANTIKSPRLIKTHLPMSMLPPKLLEVCKVVYVCRNPKDACVSFYKHSTEIVHKNCHGSFQAYAENYKEGLVEYGSYWYHLKDGWSRRKHPNMKFLWYEDMKAGLIPIIRDVTKFLGYHLTELRILQLDDFLDFKNMQQRMRQVQTEQMAKFYRKGQVGDWKNHFEGGDLEKWDAWIEENLRSTDIRMKFE